MDIREIRDFTIKEINDPDLIQVKPEEAYRPDIAGMPLFEEPLIGLADAQSEYYKLLIDNDEANIDLAPPTFWLKNAKAVVSFFFPFTERMRKTNKQTDDGYPSPEWLHGRVHGQAYLMGFIKRLQQYILEQGYEAVVPQQDERWWQNAEATVVGPDGRLRRIYSTNWSERHAAFGAGLGTFSLTGNFITEKGTAGRLVSLVTSAPIKGEKAFLLRSDLPGIYDNCTLCGACKKRCPVGAIPDEPGTKIILTCRTFMGRVSKARTPLWGCGLCQAAIPCEHTNPARKKIV